MRFVEFKNGLITYVSGEEFDMLKMFAENKAVNKKDLSERELAVVNNLVNKEIIIRRKQNESITYRVSKNAEYSARTN